MADNPKTQRFVLEIEIDGEHIANGKDIRDALQRLCGYVWPWKPDRKGEYPIEGHGRPWRITANDGATVGGAAICGLLEDPPDLY